MSTVTRDDRTRWLQKALRFYRKTELTRASFVLATWATSDFPEQSPTKKRWTFSDDVQATFFYRMQVAQGAGWPEHDARIFAFIADEIDRTDWSKPDAALLVASYILEMVNASGDRSANEQIQTLGRFLAFAEPGYLLWFDDFQRNDEYTSGDDYSSVASKIHPSLWGVTNIELWLKALSQILIGIRFYIDQDWTVDKDTVTALLALGSHAKKLQLGCQALVDESQTSITTLGRKHSLSSEACEGIRSIATGNGLIANGVESQLMKSIYGIRMLIVDQRSCNELALKINAESLLKCTEKLEIPEDIQIYCWETLLTANKTQTASYKGVGYPGVDKMKVLVEDHINCTAVRVMVMAQLTEDLKAATAFGTVKDIASLLEILIRKPATEEEDHANLLDLLLTKARDNKNHNDQVDTALANLARRQSARSSAIGKVDEAVSYLMSYVDKNIGRRHCLTIATILGPPALPHLERKFEEATGKGKSTKQIRLIVLMRAADKNPAEIPDLLRQVTY